MGQFGLSFVLPVFLQDGKHLTAAQNGLWLLPTGVFVIVGAQVGGRLIRASARRSSCASGSCSTWSGSC